MDLQNTLKTALLVAEKATFMMGQMFRLPAEKLQMDFKEKDGDTAVTIIDRKVGNFIVDELHRAFPDHSIWDEDASVRIELQSDFEWHSDPLDGTRNVQFGIPQSVVGINLNFKERTVISIVGNPFEHTLTYALRGTGTRVLHLDTGRTRLVSVDRTKDPKKMMFLMDSFFPEKVALRKQTALALLTDRALHVGSFGSNLYHWSLVAQGRAHYVLTDTVGGYWDIAGHLLVTEAGGRGTNLYGGEPTPGCQVAFGSAGGDDHDELLRHLELIYRGYQGFR